jgi:hypothetical protein
MTTTTTTSVKISRSSASSASSKIFHRHDSGAYPCVGFVVKLGEDFYAEYAVRHNGARAEFRDVKHFGGQWCDAERTADNKDIRRNFRQLLRAAIVAVTDKMEKREAYAAARMKKLMESRA